MSYFDSPRQQRRKQQREEPEVEVVIVERIETRQLPLVIWIRRRCPFCESEELRVTGTKDTGELRYWRCGGCRQSFRVREQ